MREDPTEVAVNLAEVGARIAAARTAKGLSTQGLATKMGLSKATIGHWETGTNSIKSIELVRLCRLLDVSADHLLFGVRRWPFEKINFDAVAALDSGERMILEGSLLAVAAQIGVEITKPPQQSPAGAAAPSSDSRRHAA